jgi:hypothetical protein
MWDATDNHSDTSVELNATIRDFRARLWSWLWVRSMVRWVGVWCFVWGTGVLVTRAALGASSTWLHLGWLGIIAAGMGAAWAARRGVPTVASVRAMLDTQSHAGGLVMASEEMDLGPWQDRVRKPVTPDIAWKGGRSLLILLVAVGFLLAGFIVPSRFITVGPSRPMDISDVVATQEEQIETLATEELIDADEAAELAEALDQIQSDSEGTDPVKTWEAIDHMSQMLEGLADEAVEEALADAEAIAQAQALAEALDRMGQELDPTTMAEAMVDLADRVDQACRESDALSKSLSESLTSACSTSSLSAEQLKELADQLSDCRNGQAGSLSELANAGLIDPALLDQLAQAGQCDAQELADQLSQMGAASESLADAGVTTGEQIDQCLNECTGGPDATTEGDGPGRGGISRGGGDAAMTWGDPSNREGATFDAQALTPSELLDLRRTQLAGVSAGAPDATGGDASTGGGLDSTGRAEGSAHGQTLLPRHKRTVERYFQRTDTPAESAD